jgi:hypothetical protein
LYIEMDHQLRSFSMMLLNSGLSFLTLFKTSSMILF